MTTLREATIIIPKSRPAFYKGDYANLESNWTTRALVVDRLRRAFGGVTITECEGHWAGDGEENIIEPVWIITVPAKDNVETIAFLKLCALFANDRGRQVCTYVRYPDGTVELVG